LALVKRRFSACVKAARGFGAARRAPYLPGHVACGVAKVANLATFA
jgi:hypothetical protein